MDLLALEEELRSLEQRLDSTELCLTVSTVLVVLGLILEYWLEVAELIHTVRLRFRKPLMFGFLPPFPWKSVQVITGGLLVTAGVAGELYFQFFASKLETRIRSTSGQIETVLKEKAAKLEHDAAPRRLTLTEKESLSYQMKRFSGRTIWIQTYALDPDGYALEKQVQSALEPTIRVFAESISAVAKVEFGIHIRGPGDESDLDRKSVV